MNTIAYRFATYSSVGVVGTLVHFVVLNVAVSRLGLGVVFGSCAGALAGALTNYLLNYHFNYRSSTPHSVALPSFMLVATSGFVLNGLMMAAFTEFAPGLNYLLAQAATTIVVLGWNFTANHCWTFRTTSH